MVINLHDVQGEHLERAYARLHDAERERDELRAALLVCLAVVRKFYSYRNHTGAMNATHMSEQEWCEKAIKQATLALREVGGE